MICNNLCLHIKRTAGKSDHSKVNDTLTQILSHTMFVSCTGFLIVLNTCNSESCLYN